MVEVNGKADNWLYMGFKGFDGNRIGSAIFISDKTRREGEAWYLINHSGTTIFLFQSCNPLFETTVCTPGRETSS